MNVFIFSKRLPSALEYALDKLFINPPEFFRFRIRLSLNRTKLEVGGGGLWLVITVYMVKLQYQPPFSTKYDEIFTRDSQMRN